MNKKQIEQWLFPPVPETEPLEYEHISNKRFILMVSVTIVSMIIAKLVTKL